MQILMSVPTALCTTALKMSMKFVETWMAIMSVFVNLALKGMKVLVKVNNYY